MAIVSHERKASSVLAEKWEDIYELRRQAPELKLAP